MHATLTVGPLEATLHLIVAALRQLDRALLAVFTAIWDLQVRAGERARFESLDDAALADMGLTRTDVERETARPFWMG
jgi:uncharacterized protein YjiS (DUF1127 family)